MKGKILVGLVVVILFTAVILFSNLASARIPRVSSSSRWIGVMAMDATDFHYVKEWGGTAVSLQVYEPLDVVQNALSEANALGLKLATRQASEGAIQNPATKGINLDSFAKFLTNIYANNQLAEILLGTYTVDEPCHDRWKLSTADLINVHSRLKAVNPNIKDFINFDYPQCLKNHTAAANKEFVNVAAMALTIKKFRYYSDFLPNANAAAKAFKLKFPKCKVVMLVGLYGYKDQPMPTAAEFEAMCDAVFQKVPDADGIMVYPFKRSYWTGSAVSDVKDNDEYVAAIKRVFAKAKNKWR